MIVAEFSRKDEHLSLCMAGHAGCGESGCDLVCAAVSGIFYSLIGYAANECRELNIRALSSGYADIECSLDAEQAMRQAYIGFLQIGMTYPGTVSLSQSLWQEKLRSVAI